MATHRYLGSEKEQIPMLDDSRSLVAYVDRKKRPLRMKAKSITTN